MFDNQISNINHLPDFEEVQDNHFIILYVIFLAK